MLRERKGHCLEGALLAAAALRVNGHPPLAMDLEASETTTTSWRSLHRRLLHAAAYAAVLGAILVCRVRALRRRPPAGSDHGHGHFYADQRSFCYHSVPTQNARGGELREFLPHGAEKCAENELFK